MVINQFYDKGLAHASYAVIRGAKMVVIDPGRNPQPYYNFAVLHEADLVGVIETHPHADFVSSHLEIHQTTGATVYVSKLAGAIYPHETFDDGDVIELSDIKLRAINTPGHSPDSICVLVEDENGKKTALFTGDTLFVGDVGRPDLRENAGNITAQKEELAKQMYHSTREKIMTLPHQVKVYPAHGPGSLCGKNMSPDLESSIGRELRENYALQLMDEFKFVNMLTSDQPFIPKYFEYDVVLNKQGARSVKEAIAAVPVKSSAAGLKKGTLLIDTRPVGLFRQGHSKSAINLQDGEKFETWLGSIVSPDENFYLLAADEQSLSAVITKTSKIGYEKKIAAGIISAEPSGATSPMIDLTDFKAHPSQYTIIDVRNWNEINEQKTFQAALTIPLPELRERINEIPVDRPIMVHCAAGYRSAAASSIIAGVITEVQVFDLGEFIIEFMVHN